LAHKGAKIGVLPLFDPSMRQALALKQRHARPPCRMDLRRARKFAFSSNESLQKRRFGGGADALDFDVHRYRFLQAAAAMMSA
jgi:hypothetical protein